MKPVCCMPLLFDKFGNSVAASTMGGSATTTGTTMLPPPLRATIETTVENVPAAILEAGFRPGHQLRIQVESIDDDEDTPPGFVLIESDGKRMLSGVTLEILPQALKKLGIGPDETFSIIVRRDVDSSGSAKPDDDNT